MTYEARQAVLNLCAKPDGPGARKPVEGIVLPGLLVVHGTHFTYNGRLVDRKAGASAGKLMTSWRKARSLNPSLFEQISVMSQPSANVDAIIFSWSIQKLCRQFPLALHQRDCFSAAWSPSAHEVLYLSQHLQTS